VTIPAIDPVVSNVMLMRKLYRLITGDERLGNVCSAIEIQYDPEDSTNYDCNQHDAQPRKRICAAWKDLWHIFDLHLLVRIPISDPNINLNLFLSLFLKLILSPFSLFYACVLCFCSVLLFYAPLVNFRICGKTDILFSTRKSQALRAPLTDDFSTPINIFLSL
jgi:hypothetical protein